MLQKLDNINYSERYKFPRDMNLYQGAENVVIIYTYSVWIFRNNFTLRLFQYSNFFTHLFLWEKNSNSGSGGTGQLGSIPV